MRITRFPVKWVFEREVIVSMCLMAPPKKMGATTSARNQVQECMPFLRPDGRERARDIGRHLEC